MTVARPWPTYRAQAKCALIAADFLMDEAHDSEASTLCELASDGVSSLPDGRACDVRSDTDFREMLADLLAWEAEEIEPAVAWVYGDAPAAPRGQSPRRRRRQAQSAITEPVVLLPGEKIDFRKVK